MWPTREAVKRPSAMHAAYTWLIADALEAAGIEVIAEREVVTVRLKQEVPGQLGLLTRRMADAGVNIEVLYSDHDHQLILVVDDLARGREVAAAW